MIFFAVCPKNFEPYLAKELTSLKATNIKESLGGVYFEAKLDIAYEITLTTRLANKILLILQKSAVKSVEECYIVAKSINWSDHFDVSKTFIIRKFRITRHT